MGEVGRKIAEGLRLQKAAGAVKALAAPLTNRYSYDDLNRLTPFESKLGGTIVATGAYSYDAVLVTKPFGAATLVAARMVDHRP